MKRFYQLVEAISQIKSVKAEKGGDVYPSSVREEDVPGLRDIIKGKRGHEFIISERDYKNANRQLKRLQIFNNQDMKHMKKIFISGKISGTSIDDTYHKFHNAKFDVMLANDDKSLYEPIIPLEFAGIHFGIDYEKALLICEEKLRECDAIYMLADWEDSNGARKELKLAEELGLKIFYQS